MPVTLLVTRLALATVLAVAGLSKLARPQALRTAVLAFGVPPQVARPAAVAIPIGELLAAALLMVDSTARVGGVLALVLLGAFTAAIGVNLRKGNKPDCHCFGQLHSTPIGPSTLARNAVLAAGASLVAWQGGGSSAGSGARWVADAASPALAVAAIALIVVCIQSSFVVQLMRQQGRLLTRIEILENYAPPEPEGLPVGTTAPAFRLTSQVGRVRTLEELRNHNRRLVLVFTSATCSPCQSLLPDVDRWQREHTNEVTIVVITDQPLDNRAGKDGDPETTLIDADDAVGRAYGVHATPSAVLVDPDGRVEAPLAAGTDRVRHLLATAIELSLPVSEQGRSGYLPNGSNPTTEVRVS